MAMSLNVFELRLKVYLLADIKQEHTYTVLGEFFDSYLAKNPDYLELHKTNCYKYYCFDQFYPVEPDGVYKKEKFYTVRLRMISPNLARYYSEGIANHYNGQIKGLTAELRKISKKSISELYTITPAVMKCEAAVNEQGEKVQQSGGYWRGCLSFEAFEQRIKVNLIKKYNALTETKMDEDFELYRQIELINRKPIAIPYKGVRLLGDKLRMQVSENEQAQKLAYMALGTGICEMNARGFGFLNYKFL